MRAIVEKTKDGFSGYFEDIPGATVGKSLQEMRENFEEIRELHIECLQEEGKPYRKLANAEIKLVIDMKQFFEYFDVINKSALSKRLGINSSLLRQYANGLAPIADERVKRISDELNRLGEELQSVSLT